MAKGELKERYLLSAFACDPVTGSEPYVGWNWAVRLASKYDLTVLTRRYSRNLIDCHGSDFTANIVSFDLPFCEKKDHYWKWIKPYYIVWQIFGFFLVLILHIKQRFKYVHHLTYNAVDFHGFLAFLPKVKAVIGPLGGGQIPPTCLKEVYGVHWNRQKMRAVSKCFARLNPAVVCSLRRAHLVLFANKETSSLVEQFCRRSALLLETAINPRLSVNYNQRGMMKFLWLGNVIDRKALVIALDAVAKAKELEPDIKFELNVVGDGPLLPAAKLRSDKLGISDIVKFHGKVPFADVDVFMSSSHAFLFTSVQDTSGNVLLEAMAAGLAVVCLDHQGAGAIVKHGAGIKIQVGDYHSVVEKFAHAMVSLSKNPEHASQLGRNAVDHIRCEHTWDVRLAQFNLLLQEA